MKSRRITLTTVLFAVAVLTSAVVLAKDDTRIAAVKAAELARFEANVNADSKALGLLLGDDLDYVHSNGDIDTKTSFIESLTSGRRDYQAMTANIQTVRLFGDVAIVRGTVKVTVASNGKPQDLDLGYTDFWVWRAHRWQMVAWHSSRYAAPASAAPH